MKSIVRFFSICLVFLLMTGVFTVYPKGSEERGSQTESKEETLESVNKKGFPIVDEPITLNILVRAHPLLGKFEEMPVWKKYEEMTGIKIEWEQVSKNSFEERFNIIMATGEYPDCVLKAVLNAVDLQKYGQQDIFLDLKNYMEYAPNFADTLKEYPNVERAITFNDDIYGVPYLNMSIHNRFPKFHLNTKWIDKLGMSMPRTTDEYYQLAKAIKNSDPNENGKNDEIPLTSPDINGIVDLFKGSWGLGNRGLQHRFVDKGEDGNLRFICTDPKYMDMLRYLNKLYSEKLLDEEIFTHDHAMFVSKAEEYIVGSHPMSLNYAGENRLDYKALPWVLEGPHGDQVNSRVLSMVLSPGCFVITTANKHPEATMRWVDYFYSDEGNRFYMFGIEGETYKINDKGDLVYLYEGKEIHQYIPFGGGFNPTYLAKDFKNSKMHPNSIYASKPLAEFMPSEIWEQFNFNQDDNKRLSILKTDIETYIDEMTAKLIVGDASFDKWNEYVSNLEKMGLNEYMEIYKRGYDSYIGK